MPIIDTKACQCALCGHIWIPGQWRKVEEMPLPTWCAACKSAKWNGSAPIVMKPDTRVAELEEERAPAPAKPKVERKVARPKVEPKRPIGKLSMCAHKFYVLEDGTTACPRCKIG